jgi:hypothetical protein
MTRLLVLLPVCACVAMVATACGGGGGGYAPTIDPAHFVAGVDNRFFPLVPGTVFEYAVRETGEQVRVEVTADTKVILGVTCTVVHDVASIDSTVVEDTFDWYAQDDEGNVWYFGEDTTKLGGGTSSKEGSWEAGVDGAQPGIIAEAAPRVGDVYRQEYLRGEAEDQAEVLSLDESISVPFGSYTGCLMTKDFSELEPDVVEHKYYCPGVGQVAAVSVAGDPEHEELVAVTAP